MEDSISQDQRYIIDESTEISVGEFPWIEKFFQGFPAFRHRNYQLYFAGQLISLIGTWLQMVAQGWLVLQITHSAFWVGVVSGLGTLPVLFFSLFGGIIIDRLPKRNILIFTQAASMVLAFILGLLTIAHTIDVFSISVLSFLLGIVTALDLPTRQAFAVELVGKEALTSAIALNSGTFNSARVVGPGIAGIIIASLGVGGAFILNGVSYLAVLVALLCIEVKQEVSKVHPHPLQAITEGIRYCVHHPVISQLLLFAGVTSLFGFSYSTVMPVIAQNTFHLNAAGLGYLYSASGIGALVATILLSVFSKKISPVAFILGGSAFFILFITAFTFTDNVVLAMISLFFAGGGIILQFATINSTIQHIVPDGLRGRVLSIYTVVFLGMMPLGSFLVGFLSENYGTALAIRLGAFIVLLFGIYFYFRHKEIA